jgi:hypothetical protein
MPVGIAELGMPGVPPVRVAEQIPSECRADLITVDDRPVPVRVVGTTASALALEPLRMEACDGEGAPVAALGAGEHVLRTADGQREGFDVDRLSLASDAGGEAATGVPRAVDEPEARPRVEVVSSGRAKSTVKITGVTRPFWLVMGQSANAGWRATVDGKELGESTLVEGYANGWLVRPTGRGPIEATIEWVPQRTVNRAIAASIVGALVCFGILVGAFVRRRRRRAEPVAAVEGDAPVFASPFVAPGRTPGVVGVVIAGLVALVVGSVVVTPWVGVVLAALVVVVLVRPRWRLVLSLLPAVILAGCGAYIAAKQFRTDLPPTFEWPTFFWQVRTAGWLAIVFLAGDALVEIVRSRGQGGEPGPGRGDGAVRGGRQHVDRGEGHRAPERVVRGDAEPFEAAGDPGAVTGGDDRAGA